VAAPPKIDGSSVAVVADGHVKAEINGGEIVVVGGGEDEGGTRSEKRDVERPKIFESRGDVENDAGAKQGGVGVGTPIEGGDNQPDLLLEGSVEVGGEGEKQEVVGEEGDDEGVNKEDAFVGSEGAENGLVGLCNGRSKNPLQGGIPTNRDAKVGGFVNEGQVGPGATGKEGRGRKGHPR
jgi:hypothetical protein